MRNNIIIDTDSYKLSHFKQRGNDIEHMFYYLEARSHDGKLNVGFRGNLAVDKSSQAADRTLFYGLQYILTEYLSKPVSMLDLQEAESYFNDHGPTWNKDGWLKLIAKYKGKLPIRIKAVPEGSIVPLSNVLVTIESLDPEFAWLLGYLETLILRVWYPTTVATQSWLIKQDFKKYWKKTSTAPIESLNFKLHDFGSRGVSSRESAAWGGSAHLTNFLGSDTLVALPFVNQYYGLKDSIAAYSVDAAEHSTILPWGKEHEAEAYAHIIDTYAKGGIVSIVSDSYDHWNAVENIFGGELKEKIINSGGLVVIRPDSGDPATVVLKTIDILMQKFGFTINDKGYRVLPDYIRVIQGDGVNRKSINTILSAMELNTMSIDNITFGMGGALLQRVNRDTFAFAIKPSAVERAIEVDNVQSKVWEGVSKNPIDMGSKKSKAGRLDLIKQDGEYKTVDNLNGVESELVTVYEMGKVQYVQTFDEVRARVESY